MAEKTAVIIGAGPAGLTAAYELLARTDIKPLVLEQSEQIGGLSQTAVFDGYRLDIGPHRFFSKSERVVDWWLDKLPLLKEGATEPAAMLTVQRQSRIYFLRKFFTYPLDVLDVVLRLPPLRTIKIIVSYFKSALWPIRPEKSFEDFFINRFGRQLYATFFEDYTRKLWGVAPKNIAASWGAQRIKGLSIIRLVQDFLRRRLKIFQAARQVETSLIEEFFYPQYGAGQLWQRVADRIIELGGQIKTGQRVVDLRVNGNLIKNIGAVDSASGQKQNYQADYVFSTMPLQDLIPAISGQLPPVNVLEVARGLVYRDLINVGLVVKKLLVGANGVLIKDNWIYLQEPGIKAGRLQIANNMSPYLLADNSKVLLGVEYFCNENDELWNLTDEQLKVLAISELSKIGLIDDKDLVIANIQRAKKAYPAYFGSYQRLPEVVAYLNGLDNLFPIGRNGMHKYNNQDHSMLTAMAAVDKIISGQSDKSSLWQINTEADYHESR